MCRESIRGARGRAGAAPRRTTERAGTVKRPVEQGTACFGLHVDEIRHLHHHGDEAFISAALCLLAEQGYPMVEVGAYRKDFIWVVGGICG